MHSGQLALSPARQKPKNSIVMSRVFLALSLVVLWFLGHQAWAQVDSSSAVLLRSSGKGPTRQTLDSSSRYKIRAPESSRKDDEDLDEKPGTFIPTPVPTKTVTVKSSASATNKEVKAQSTTTVQVSEEPPTVKESVPATVPPPDLAPQIQTLPKPQQAVEAPTEEKRPPVVEQVRELFMGGTQEEIEEARKQIHPQDPRANVLSIDVAPAYFYNDSNSGYSFRRYTSNGPGFGLGANLWFTPFFGLQSKFFSSVGASVRSGGTDMIPMDVQTFEAGFRFRKHFGYSRKAPQLLWGIDYTDATNKINSEATTVIGRKTSGLSLSFGAVIPTSNSYAHTMNVDIRPRLTHAEQSTSADVKSGGNSETNALSLSLGGEWTLDRRNQVFWKSQYSVERNLFKGEVSTMDPHNDQTPDGVSVTNSLFIFYFGFKWGS
jgi:hypothetical protein